MGDFPLGNRGFPVGKREISLCEMGDFQLGNGFPIGKWGISRWEMGDFPLDNGGFPLRKWGNSL